MFGPGKRWLVVAPAKDSSLGIVLEVPHGEIAQTDRIGKETNWVFQVADCHLFYERLNRLSVHFRKAPQQQPWGTTQAIFEDPYGNIFVAESNSATPPSTHASQ